MLKSLERWRTRKWGYGFALIAFLVSFGLRYGLNDWLPPGPYFVLFLPAVVLTTFFAGLWPGLFVTALSGLVSWFFFISPFGSFELDAGGVLALGTYVFGAAVSIALIHFLNLSLVEKRQNEQKLQESTALLTAVIGSAMDAIVSIDENYRIIHFNKAAEQMFGCPTSDALGSPIDRFVPERFRDRHSGHIETFKRTGISTRRMGHLGAIYGRRSNGEEFPIEAAISQVTTSQHRIFTVILRDITVQERQGKAMKRALEQAEASARQRETMFTELQHRISNNLQLVSALLNLERAHVSDERAKRALTDASLRLALIGKLHRKLHDPSGAGLDFGIFLKELCDDILGAWGSRHIGCTVNSTKLTVPVETSIPIALVATELISNALEHGFDGRPQGMIDINLQRNDGGAIVLTIADDGNGLPPEFDETKDKSLGLRVVRSLTKQLGGHFEMVGGKGTTCRLVIPGA